MLDNCDFEAFGLGSTSMWHLLWAKWHCNILQPTLTFMHFCGIDECWNQVGSSGTVSRPQVLVESNPIRFEVWGQPEPCPHLESRCPWSTVEGPAIQAAMANAQICSFSDGFCPLRTMNKRVTGMLHHCTVCTEIVDSKGISMHRIIIGKGSTM